MDRERESPPERLPFCLDDTVGEIVRACQECPGVYYIAARKQDGRFLADEYYVVERSSPAISKEAMAYGRMSEEDSRVLLYPFAEERHGYKIIEYEIYRYQVRHGMYADGQTSLRDVAFFNMEYHPEYFGPYRAYPGQLSGGMLQRVTMAILLGLSPRYIFADEPTSALDEDNKSYLTQELARMKQQSAILFVSHDDTAIRTLCDELLVMQNGTIAERGTTSNLVASPQEEWTKEFVRLASTEEGGGWTWNKSPLPM